MLTLRFDAVVNKISHSPLHEGVWEVYVWLHSFLTSVFDGDELSASRPGRFTPEERAAGTHLYRRVDESL